METPSPGPSPSGEGSTVPELLPERGDREVLAFLARSLVPALGSRSSPELRAVVRRALAEGRLAPLERLSGRDRHELLRVIEQVSEGRHRPSPAALVRLTTVVSATPALPERAEISAARPAR